MRKKKRTVMLLFLALGACVVAGRDAGAANAKTRPAAKPTQGPAQKAPPAPQLDPKAVDVLKAASARLAAARTLAFTAVTTYESPSRIGPPLAYTTISHVTLQRPDKLAVVTPGDGPASEFYYDGKTMTAFSPGADLVAVADAPPTIEAMLKAAYASAAIYFPFTDLVVPDPYGAMAGSLEKAFYIGQSTVVGGTTTDMVGIVGNGVFAQIWIGADDKLPRRMRAMYAADPAMLRNDLELSDWKLDAPVAADAFATPRAAGATRIDFARPDPEPPANVPGILKGKPAAAKKKQ